MSAGNRDAPSEVDRHHLARALELAERGRGAVHPNPVVGCVLVHGGTIVGEGHHREFGGPHAEALALAQAGERARGATAYVSLEPCAHHGKTPPCAEALARAGVVRVVFAAADPGPGAGGADRLREAGLVVLGPVAEREAERQNAAFLHIQRTGRPYLALKLAMSLDGKISEVPDRSTAITGPEAAAAVHALRREFDALMVGARTLRADDPLLTIRDGRVVRRAPARVVLDSRLSFPPSARMLSEPGGGVHVFTGPAPDPVARARLESSGAHVHSVSAGPGGLDLYEVIDRLWDLDLRAVLCEGGGRLASSLLRADLVQRLYLFASPVVIGPGGVPAFAEPCFGRGWTPHPSPKTFGADVLVIWDRSAGADS